MKVDIKPEMKFGKLTVIGEGEKFKQPGGQTQRGIICKCDCGNIKTIRLSHLIRLRIKSCGCINPPIKNYHKRLYGTWRGMRNRCNLDTYIQPQYYKDKGITVCDEWNTYNVFAEWALNNGWKDGLTIDRIESNKGYYPENCRFVTQFENNLNRVNTKYVIYKGEKIAFYALLKNKGLFRYRFAITGRLNRGYSIERAISQPIRTGNYHRKYE
jgi:hypothetical protein